MQENTRLKLTPRILQETNRLFIASELFIPAWKLQNKKAEQGALLELVIKVDINVANTCNFHKRNRQYEMTT